LEGIVAPFPTPSLLVFVAIPYGEVLSLRVYSSSALTLLVFNGVNLPVSFLDHIGLTADTERTRIQVDTPQLQHRVPCTGLARLHSAVLQRAFHRVLILDKDVLDEDVVTTPGTIVVLIEGRQKDKLSGIHNANLTTMFDRVADSCRPFGFGVLSVG
jgi:hypothetical protein